MKNTDVPRSNRWPRATLVGIGALLTIGSLALLLMAVAPQAIVAGDAQASAILTPAESRPLAGGGPDAFGYTFKEASEPGGPTYAWEDIAATGALITSWQGFDDAYAGPIPIGFNFSYYGVTYDTLFVGTNGYISFGAGYGAIPGGTLPSDSWPNNDIALFGGDMYLYNYGADSAVYYQTLSNPTRFVLQFVDLYYCCGPNTPHTFQAILYAGGDILVQYQMLNGTTTNYVGIENADGADGLSYGAPLSDDLAIRYYHPVGVLLRPETQSGLASAGSTITYALDLINQTGAADRFDVALQPGNAWMTSLSLTQTGFLTQGAMAPLAVQVSVPAAVALDGMDVAAIQATSVTSPSTFYATAVMTTAVSCESLSFSGQSERTEADLDVVHEYAGQRFAYAYIYGFSSDSDTLNATISGYDPGQDLWQVIAEQLDGGSGDIVDQTFIPPTYTRIRVQLDDTEDNDLIFYDYEFLVCRQPAVNLSPDSQRILATAGATVSYDFSLTNYMMATDSFDLTVAGQAWPTTLRQGATPITQTGPLADLAAFTFTVQVDTPPDAAPGQASVATIQATSAISPAISASATLTTTISGRLAYVTLSSSNLVAVVDTVSHTLIDAIAVGGVGCHYPWRAALSPAGDQLYVSCFNSGSVVIVNTADNSIVATVGGINNANGIAFTFDGAYALVGSRWRHEIAVIDTASHLIVGSIPTPDEPRSIVAHPFLPLAYATSADGSILVVDTNAFTIVDAIPVGSEPWDVAMSPDGQWVFTGDRWGAGLSVIDAASNTVYTTVGGLGDLNGLAVAPDGSKIYAGGLGNGVHVIDATTFTPITTISGVGTVWELAATCDGSQLYVGNTSSQTPYIDTASYAVLGLIPLSGGEARGIAICPQHVADQVVLIPPAQTNAGVPGQVVAHQARLLNVTGASDSFALALGSHNWATALSVESIGPIAHGESVNFTLYVTVPVEADWYVTDVVSVTATSVASPTLYSAAARFTTEAFAPPQINLSPDSLASTQYVGQIVSRTLTISNGHGVTLTFELAEQEASSGLALLEAYARPEEERAAAAAAARPASDGDNEGEPTVSAIPAEAFAHLNGPTRILAWVAYTDYRQEYTNALNAIAQHTAFSLAETTTADPTALAGALQNADVFLVPEQELASYSFLHTIGAAWRDVLADFLADGGVIVFMDHCNRTIGLVEGAELMDLTQNNCPSSGAVEVVEPAHPLAAGLPASFYGERGTASYGYTDGEVIVRRVSGGEAVVAAKEIGPGRVVMVGFDFYYYNNVMARLLANAVQWYGSRDVGWLSLAPTAGAVPTLGAMPVQVTLNADGVQPGDHTANIVVQSNDPQTPSLFVPTAMTVLPTADIGRVAGDLSNAWTGAPLAAQVTLVGVHTGAFEGAYELWAPAGAYSLTAQAAGYFPVTRSVVIAASDVVTEDLALEPMQARLEWTPPVIEAVAYEGGSTSRPLLIWNRGWTPLEIVLREIDLSKALDAPSPLDLEGRQVLYDRAHNEPGLDDYAQLAADVAAAGVDITENWYFPIDAAALAGYDILWVNCCGDIAWEYSEMMAVDQWLQDGGAILIQGENSAATAGLASVFGIHYLASSCASGVTTNVHEHPISEGVSALAVEETCWRLAPSSWADIVVFDPIGQPHVVAQEQDGGKMVVVAGRDFADWRIDDEDNRLLANNSLAWLARPGYSNVPWLSESPTIATISAQEHRVVTVNFFAWDLSPGVYPAIVAIQHNDPLQPTPAEVPVTLTVEMPTAVTLSGLAADEDQAPAAPSLPAAALPAVVAAALFAAYRLQRRR